MTIQADNIWYGAIMLIGGLGLFIYGINIMSEGLQLAAGDRLRRLLENLTRTRFRGVGAGALVTVLVQSSSATTVMLVGFVNAGLMTFTQSVAVIFGANVGTTVTAQIVAFNVKAMAFPMIALGLILYMVGDRRRVKYSGQVILGFGVLFLGMELMKAAMYPLQTSGAFENWLSSYGSNWIIGLLLGMVITALLQSSSATTALLIAMGASGALSVSGVDPLQVAIPVILGCNIGTCITAMLASIGTSLPARRVATAHYIFNITGVLLFLPFLKWMPALVLEVTELFGGSSDNIARQIAWAHTIFNVAITLIWLPFINWFVKLVKFIKRGDDPTAARDPLFLDPRIFHNPGVAMEMARKEISRMAQISMEMLKESIGFLTGIERGARKALMEQESIVDGLASDITGYMTRLSQEQLTDSQSEKMVGLMHAINDIERIADHAENVMYLASSKQENGLDFSETAWQELDSITGTVIEMYHGIIDSFNQEDVQAATRYQTLEHQVDEMASSYRRNHMARLQDGKCDPTAGVIFLDLLTNLERVGDLANNIGHVITGNLDSL